MSSHPLSRKSKRPSDQENPIKRRKRIEDSICVLARQQKKSAASYPHLKVPTRAMDVYTMAVSRFPDEYKSPRLLSTICGILAKVERQKRQKAMHLLCSYLDRLPLRSFIEIVAKAFEKDEAIWNERGRKKAFLNLFECLYRGMGTGEASDVSVEAEEDAELYLRVNRGFASILVLLVETWLRRLPLSEDTLVLQTGFYVRGIDGRYTVSRGCTTGKRKHWAANIDDMEPGVLCSPYEAATVVTEDDVCFLGIEETPSPPASPSDLRVSDPISVSV